MNDPERVALRRRLHAVKEELIALGPGLAGIDPLAAQAVSEARNGVFLAWTILATPLEDDGAAD